jgi:threonine dehydrogenase-like Zn-dependent dehydrogenase
MGQTNVHKYLRPLLKLILDGKIDPSFVITHRLALNEGAYGYSTFKENKDECIKIVMKPELN